MTSKTFSIEGKEWLVRSELDEKTVNQIKEKETGVSKEEEEEEEPELSNAPKSWYQAGSAVQQMAATRGGKNNQLLAGLRGRLMYVFAMGGSSYPASQNLLHYA